MRIIPLLAALAVLTGCAHSDEWRTQDTVLQSIYTGLVIVDAVQTADIQYRDDLVESGPLASRVLGDNPSSSDTYQYMATLAISHYLISRALPAKWRPYWQGFGIIDHGSAVISNCAHGLGRICEEN